MRLKDIIETYTCSKSHLVFCHSNPLIQRPRIQKCDFLRVSVKQYFPYTLNDSRLTSGLDLSSEGTIAISINWLEMKCNCSIFLCLSFLISLSLALHRVLQYYYFLGMQSVALVACLVLSFLGRCLPRPRVRVSCETDYHYFVMMKPNCRIFIGISDCK